MDEAKVFGGIEEIRWTTLGISKNLLTPNIAGARIRITQSPAGDPRGKPKPNPVRWTRWRTHPKSVLRSTGRSSSARFAEVWERGLGSRTTPKRIRRFRIVPAGRSSSRAALLVQQDRCGGRSFPVRGNPHKGESVTKRKLPNGSRPGGWWKAIERNSSEKIDRSVVGGTASNLDAPERRRKPKFGGVAPFPGVEPIQPAVTTTDRPATTTIAKP